MLKSPYQPCIPTRGTKVPAGPDWLHEIKHDGYRLIIQRDGDSEGGEVRPRRDATIMKAVASRPDMSHTHGAFNTAQTNRCRA